METGTGLFLGLALIALVILYLGTQDKWNWKLIIFIVVVLPLLAVLGGNLSNGSCWWVGPVAAVLYLVFKNKIHDLIKKIKF